MKTVETLNPYVEPSAANIDDMTQPMGPLEEGDQALVDATHKLPEGPQEIRHDDGGVTWANKSESLGQHVAVINTRNADGSYENASALINTVPGIAGISADMGHSTAWDQGGGSRARVSGNSIGSDVMNMKAGTHHAEAQAIKLEVASKINAAAEQLGHDAVEHASKTSS
jgi:hypothetical protein